MKTTAAIAILMTILLALIFSGCTSKQETSDTSEATPGLTENKAPSNSSNLTEQLRKSNIKVLYSLEAYKKGGKLPLIVRYTEPRLNETVLTVFKFQSGKEWYDKTMITNLSNLTNGNWTRRFSINPGNESYVRVAIRVYENKTMIDQRGLNITFKVPVAGNNT